MISGSNEQLQQELEYTLLKPDCHSWWISKMQSGRDDILEERYAIKFCFKLGKKCHRNGWNASDCFRPSYMNRASVFEWVRESRKAGSLWGMMRGVGGVRKSIHQSWWAKGLGLGLLCWGFKGVQEEIPSEAASTLQIGSVAFPPGQYTSPQLHPCHRLFDQDGHQDSSSTSQTLLPVTFAYSVSSEAVVMRQLRRWKRLWWRSLTRSQKWTSMGPSRRCWNGTSVLQPEEITSKGTRVSWKRPYEKSIETYLMILVYIYIYIYISLFINLSI